LVIIKRYPNRKLYNTEEKQYITLDGVAELIRQGSEIQVLDHHTSEDLTAVTLTQIILEQERKQSGRLSKSLLTSLIRAGGDRLSTLQRSMVSSINTLQQIDEEIKRRIQTLVRQGELTSVDGDKLIKNLLRITTLRRDENGLIADDTNNLASYFKNHQFPTQDDVLRLHEQLEELAKKLDQISK